MTSETINHFLEYSAFKMPQIIRPIREHKPSRLIQDDCALLTFIPDAPLTMDELFSKADDIHGLIPLYRHCRSRQTDYAHSACFFQEPGTGDMFQMNVSTNSRGLIARIDVKLYSSLERMLTDLRRELKLKTQAGGEFFYQISEEELLSQFL